MFFRIFLCACLSVILASPSKSEEQIRISSTPKQTTFIELYTSEGCSSCPSADRWLSQLDNHKQLWKDIIPVAFHVDYWDYLGWSDRLAQHDFTLRQQKHKKQGNIKSVYTPGFVVNGEEWRGFFSLLKRLPETQAHPGILSIDVDSSQAKVTFKAAENKNLKFNMAILGSGLNNQIKAGENHGKNLKHDFIVLQHLSAYSSAGNQTFDMPIITTKGAQKYAIAAWVSESKSLKPIQAAGSWLPQEMIRTAFK